nr:RecE family exodeoxyribonuclease [uncultured Enterobacter sp.]
MEFFYFLKATQKSGKPSGVLWFSAKTEARAKLQAQVILEDAEIETGRGADYQLPARTDFPVVDDLPEEGTVDFTWCERYVLGDDGHSWAPVITASDKNVSTQENSSHSTVNDVVLVGAAADTSAPAPSNKNVNVNGESFDEIEKEMLRPVARLRLSLRLLTHLLFEKQETHISEEQQISVTELSLDEGNDYVQNLLQAVRNVPGVEELSLHNEWKLIEGFKKAFPRDKAFSTDDFTAFIREWVNAEPDQRAGITNFWRIQKTDTPVQHVVATLPFRQRLLAQFITDDNFAYHVDNDQLKTVRALEMDTDNTYAQNLLLAAENIDGLKDVKEYDLWKLTEAVKRVFSTTAKAPELALLLKFLKAWSATCYPDRGLLVKEWISGNRVSQIQRTDSGTNAGGGTTTDRSQDYEHTLDTLDIEIACATLPMNFDIYNIPVSIHRRAKDIVAAKESPFKEWSGALRKIAGILDYSRAAIFALIREASSGITPFPDRLSGYISATLTEYQHDKPTLEILAAARQIDSAAVVAGAIQGTQPVESLEGLSTEFSVVGHACVEAVQKNAPEATTQPEVKSIAPGVFSIDGLMTAPSNEVVKTESVEIADDVQMETDRGNETENIVALSESKAAALPDASVDEAGAATTAMTNREIIANACPNLYSAIHEDTSEQADGPTISSEFPAYFEPGRYEGLPNDVYHGANGISSTQVKDARVSLMYFNARHVEKTIQKERSKVLDMGNLVHALALQPETLDAEFSIEPVIPEGALTTTATIRALIDEYNASLPPQLSADDIKALLEAHNATLPAPLPLGSAVDETAQSYMALPEEFQRIEADQKQTAAAMKACIKEYNATLPAPVKTSGSRDALLEQLVIVNPDLVAQEAQKPAPLKVSGTKVDLIQALKAVRPDAVFADELLDAWRENPEGKILVTRQQYTTALAIQSALHSHPTAGKLLLHPDRAVETSYFGIDEETGLEIRVRPDLELELNGVRIGADLKTISMWNIKQSGLRAKLHREIIERDYHLSAAMYTETAALDQFFWIFVNKDEGYHWIAIVEASPELLELGALEYRTTMRAIANAFDTGEWPAPITDDYTDELNDFDLRRLEALRAQA